MNLEAIRHLENEWNKAHRDYRQTQSARRAGYVSNDALEAARVIERCAWRAYTEAVHHA